MAEIVYALCALTSVLCAVLLLRGYRSSQAKMLFWSSVCFGGLALNNVLLFVDLVLWPAGPDLGVLRSCVALGALMTLLFGCTWELK